MDKRTSPTLYSVLWALRETRTGHTQAEIAGLLGVQPGRLCEWEKGITMPPEEHLPGLAELYDLQDAEALKRLLHEDREERRAAAAAYREQTRERIAQELFAGNYHRIGR